MRLSKFFRGKAEKKKEMPNMNLDDLLAELDLDQQELSTTPETKQDDLNNLLELEDLTYRQSRARAVSQHQRCSREE